MAATAAEGGAPAAAVVDCNTLGRNRRPPLVRTMGCRSDRLRGRRRAQARATTMRKVTKKMRMRGGGGGGGGYLKKRMGMRKGLVQSRKTKRFLAGAKKSVQVPNFAQSANFAHCAKFRTGGCISSRWLPSLHYTLL